MYSAFLRYWMSLKPLVTKLLSIVKWKRLNKMEKEVKASIYLQSAEELRGQYVEHLETENAHLIEINQFLMQQIKEMSEPKVETISENAHFAPLRERENPRKQVLRISRALNKSLRRS